MDSAHTGKASWKCLHYLADRYDRDHQPAPSTAFRALINCLSGCFSCKFCRQSLGPFLNEMSTQLDDSLQHYSMRRYMYDLHNRVNDKLITQENDRLMKCINLLPFQLSAEKLETVHHEMSCILYTQLPPEFDNFLRWPQSRDEDALWTSLSSLAHGQTLNPTAVDAQYDTLLLSFCQLYWPHLFEDPTVRRGVTAILKAAPTQVTYLKKVWQLRRFFFEAQKAYNKQRLETILSQSTIDLDGLRFLRLQHKSKYDESFEDFKAEVVRWEVACRENTCRKTAVVQE